MIYAMSDLHGCYDKYVKMLEKIKFNDKDTLYILGDIVDRGPDGIKILQDVINNRINVFVLCGNHENMASRVLKVLTYSSDMYEDDNFPEIYRNWIVDGGTPTFEAFMELEYKDKTRLLSNMSHSLLFEEIEVNGKKFHLSHTVPNKKTMRAHERMPYYDYLIGEPEYEKEYFPDKIIVTGHTPTGFIDPKFKGKIWRGNNHIAIDCGAVFGNPLGCICLDTLEEFYVQ